MFIACQEEMDFREGHNAAMTVRSRTFHYKTLRSPPVAGATEFLKKHAMTPVDELLPPVPEMARSHNTFDDEERERIRNLNMDDSDSGDAMVGEASREMPSQPREGGEESEGTDDDDSCPSYMRGLGKNYE